jgi:branched-chain amino acid transport system substrate-binding protein
MTSMGPMLNGVVNYDYWAPEPTMMFPASRSSSRNTRRAPRRRRRPARLLPAALLLRGHAGARAGREATKGLDQQKIADYIRANEFNTIVGKIKFGKNGEWAKGRTLMVQYQKVQGNDIEQFRGRARSRALSRGAQVGDIIYPYAAALK